MKIRHRGVLTVLGLLAVPLALLAALMLQAHLSSGHSIAVGEPTDGAYIKLLQGWSERERSPALPVAGGTVAGTYRWTGPEATIEINPFTPRVPYTLDMRILGQASGLAPADVVIGTAKQTLIAGTLPRPNELRTVRLLVPGSARTGDTLPLLLWTRNPQQPPGEGRQIGVLVSAISADVAAPYLAQVSASLAWPWLAVALLVPIGVCGGAARTRPWRSLLAALIIVVSVGFLASQPAGPALLRWWALVALVWALVGMMLRRWGALTARTCLVAVAGVTVVLGGLLFTPAINGDGVAYYAYLRSIAEDGDLQFANEYAGRWVEVYVAMPTVTGHTPNQWSIGPGIMWSPGYGLAELMVQSCHLVVTGCAWSPSGQSLPYVALSLLISLVAGVTAAVLAYRVAVVTFRATPAAALLATVGLFISSGWLYYSTRDPAYSHALAAAVLAAFAVWWWRPGERTGRFWFVSGLLAGLVTLIYWVNVVLLVWPALGWLTDAWHKRRDVSALRRHGGYGLLAAFGALLAFSPQMVAWHILYDRWLTVPHPSGEAGIVGIGAFLWRALVGRVYGLLPWTPLIAVSLALSPLVLRFVPRPRRLEAGYVLLSIALFMLYITSIPTWSAGASFGLRRTVNFTPLLVPFFALALDWLHRVWRPLPVLVVSLGAVWTGAFFLQYIVGYLPFDEASILATPWRELFASSTTLSLPLMTSPDRWSWIWPTLLVAQPYTQIVVLAATVVLLGAGSALVWWTMRAFTVN